MVCHPTGSVQGTGNLALVLQGNEVVKLNYTGSTGVGISNW